MASKTFEIGFVNLDKVMQTYAAAPDKLMHNLKRTMYELSLELLDRAIDVTPADTQDLRRSGEPLFTEVTDTTITTGVGFGGVAAPYAVYVHEMLDPRPNGKPVNWTTPGTGNKYLERPTLEMLPEIPDKLTARMLDLFKA